MDSPCQKYSVKKKIIVNSILTSSHLNYLKVLIMVVVILVIEVEAIVGAIKKCFYIDRKLKRGIKGWWEGGDGVCL